MTSLLNRLLEWLKAEYLKAGIVGISALILTIIGLYLQGRRRDKELREAVKFPFEPISLENLFSRLALDDIPYLDRPKDEQKAKAEARSRRILITGKAGMGKTREAYEEIGKIKKNYLEETTILLPPKEGNIFKPPPDYYPNHINTNRIILLIDDIPRNR